LITELDKYFLEEAHLVGSRSKCLSRHIGAVLVRDGHRIASGYNGPAKKVPHCDYRDDKGNYVTTKCSNICPRQRMGYESGEGMEQCPAVHAEVGAICIAARFGIATEGTTLYANCPVPCSDCAKEIINAGIKRVVCIGSSESRPWSSIKSKEMFKQANVALDITGE